MNILFISASKYPSNSAEASRLHYLARLFAEDNNVTIISRGSAPSTNKKEIKQISVSNKKLIDGNIILRALDYASFLKHIKKHLQTSAWVDAIVVCALPTNVLKYLLSYTKRNHILLIHDAVEWYSPEEFKLGKLDKLYRKKELWMRKLLPGKCRIISISRYLQEYFDKQGNKTVYIPSMIDTESYDAPEKKYDGKIKLVYAGTPLKKDYLSVALKGISLLSKEEIDKIEVRIIGVSKEQAQRNGINSDIVEKLGSSLVFMGRITPTQFFEYLKAAHFSILLRPAGQRYAKAGFPTKVPESLAVGTPVICNYSSDLGDFLVDGINCIEVTACDEDAMHKSVTRILKMSMNEIEKLSINARILAIEKFDYRLYVPEVRSILE